jgi:hypothetical protein
MKKLIDLSDTPNIKRNAFLSFLLGLMVIVNTGTVILYFLSLLGFLERSANLSFWMMIFSICICIGNVICAAATWHWRRWGVIGYCFLALSAYLVISISTNNFTNFFGLVGAALLVILVSPHWKFMRKFSWKKSSPSDVDVVEREILTY